MRALWLCLCLGLVGCADNGTGTWYRADGGAHAPGQLETDKVICEQEMRKPQATRTAGLDRDVVQPDVYEKCMTRLGYTDMKPRASAAPNAAPITAPPTAAASRAAPAGAPPTSAVAGAPAPAAPDAPSPDCRKVTDLRMWLPLCP
jgi:hypothetical protein